MNIILYAILGVSAMILAVSTVFLVKARSIYVQINDFITPKDAKSGSALYQVSAAFADILARSIISHTKATFMGQQSGATRAAKAIDADIAVDSLGFANPAIAAILESFPSLKKTLRRNPQLLDVAIAKLAQKGSQNKPVVTAGNNGHSADQSSFDL